MKIFLDTSDINAIKEYQGRVDGVTTNPTLMKKAGITDYERFCKDVLNETDRPVSFEVFADDFKKMERQARLIASWGNNVYVKIPITNTKGQSSVKLIEMLGDLKLNITAVMHELQLINMPKFLSPTIISVFAGRIADTSRDPITYMKTCKYLLHGAELLWASPREVLNISQAEQVGADIITCTPELLEKYWRMRNMDLNQLSLDTVKMFYNDAKASGFTL